MNWISLVYLYNKALIYMNWISLVYLYNKALIYMNWISPVYLYNKALIYMNWISLVYLYNKAIFYMLDIGIAGQKAGTYRLTLILKTHRLQSTIKILVFKVFFKYHGQRRALQLVQGVPRKLDSW